MWIFFDERPLSEGEVLAAVGSCGRVLYSRINWAIGLTQRVMAFRRESSDAEVRRGSASIDRQSLRAESKPVEHASPGADS